MGKSKIAVLTSGGDAPGMNAAVRAVVRTASYYSQEVVGVYRGYDGLIHGDLKSLKNANVANIIHRGGTILKTARSKEFRTVEGRAQAAKILKEHDVSGLIVIGGNGSYTGAKFLTEEHGIQTVGLPGTIDNDIYGTDYTIGFDTAINTAVEAVDKIRDTADSHSRLFFIEVMGRHSGYIALHTGIGSGATSVFLPEREDSIEDFIAQLKQAGRRNKLFNLVIVAEGNKNGTASEIAATVAKEVDMDVRTAVIGHLQRGGAPTASDRVLASKLAFHGVKALVEGKTNLAIGLVNQNIEYTSFQDAINKSKSPEEKVIQMAEILAL